jgi:hypothetical protein
MQKLSVKSRVMLCKSCISTHKETNKLVLHLFRFFLDFLRIFQITVPISKETKNLLLVKPLERFLLHRYTLTSNKKALEHKILHNRALGGRGELAGGEGPSCD